MSSVGDIQRKTNFSGYSSGLSFNDFPVFGKGNKYDTTKFCYTTEEFDRLRDLMYYNVISHRQVKCDRMNKMHFFFSVEIVKAFVT